MLPAPHAQGEPIFPRTPQCTSSVAAYSCHFTLPGFSALSAFAISRMVAVLHFLLGLKSSCLCFFLSPARCKTPVRVIRSSSNRRLPWEVHDDATPPICHLSSPFLLLSLVGTRVLAGFHPTTTREYDRQTVRILPSSGGRSCKCRLASHATEGSSRGHNPPSLPVLCPGQRAADEIQPVNGMNALLCSTSGGLKSSHADRTNGALVTPSTPA